MIPQSTHKSDIVSIHCPHTAETRHLIGRDALRERWIAGAARDVLEVEPMPADHPLATLDNAILNPHAAWSSEGSVLDLKRRVATSVRRVLAGQPPAEVANPQVLTSLSPPRRLPAERAVAQGRLLHGHRRR